jgi:hypothetical protein
MSAPGVNVLVKWLVAIAQYVIGPARLYRTHTVAASGELARLSAQEEAAMPTELRTFLADTERALQVLGFGAPLRVRERPNATVVGYSSLLEHTEQTTLATVSAVSAVHAAPGRTAVAVFFRSECADGQVVLSTNSRLPRRFPRRRGHRSISFPSVVDPAALYQIHRVRTAECTQRAPLRPVTRAPDPIAYQVGETTDGYASWVAIGYYRRVSNELLRPTLRGAVCMVWRAKFPWAQLTNWRDGRTRASVLKRAAVPRRKAE